MTPFLPRPQGRLPWKPPLPLGSGGGFLCSITAQLAFSAQPPRNKKTHALPLSSHDKSGGRAFMCNIGVL